MSQPELQVRDLRVDYDARPALTDVTFSVAGGTTVAIIGPNGSGKSTLLKAIAGLITPTAGTVELDRDEVSFVLQSTDVDRAVPITVRDTVRMARYPRLGLLRPFREHDHRAVAVALDRLDVTDLRGRQLHELSGGQRQRVLVAQGLAQEAAVLLLDEPVTGLDLVSRDRILRAVDEERAAGRIVLMTTHSLEDARRCDRVLLLATRQLAFGPPDEVIVEEHLRAAFGGRVVRAGDDWVMDDPHHHH